MKTITLQEPGRLILGEMDAPARAGEGEALVRVHRVGVCGTDIHAFSGKQPFFTYPRILGHELGVEVVEVGAGANEHGIKVGDRCAVEPYINCQACIACRGGKSNCCAKMRVMGVHVDGGMREFLTVPLRKLHAANRLTYEQIALVETLAIGAHAVARADVGAEEMVLVIGAGPIGLSVIQFALAHPQKPRVMVMDVSEARLAFCREKLGIADVIDARGDAAEAVKGLTDGDMATVVIDATGNAASMCGALKFLAAGGRLVYVGLFQGDFSLSDPEFHRRETTLLGSRNALPEDFSRIIGMVEAGKIDTSPWITHRARFEEVVDVFPEWVKPESGVLKGMIEL